ncbi:ABC transporter ATP-binding protein [Frankia sp. CNm7]|uniref:ABC transporter ATP-binding protein n=2 Tax=Frankia nepalensis TaxID=1836974 RepID=A0A937UN84_9ACTN|nr:ABC transporter ATP-binding protein [Frankia nepalensis]MBL7495409.1 ABC transporter ATP-binding protein [Frankia nepalensis]MBL7514841.1 ABC transporter ATP-binding protein [Frankia nepalensis]MBL7522428.1 ABC transporter ATP-binding protein [Frankia nepalensis]MBL7625965.1 ABC transporter ATP-binding protein [Frankia nepalensis]
MTPGERGQGPTGRHRWASQDREPSRSVFPHLENLRLPHPLLGHTHLPHPHMPHLHLPRRDPHREPAAGLGRRPDAAIWTRGLTKVHETRTSVDHLDLDVPLGALSGFVGPNGAGKSTTLRMLLGLVRPTEGVGYVLGEPVSHPERYLSHVGALIEGPTFHPGLSGRENLRQLAVLRGVDKRRIYEVLRLVRLTGRAGDPFATYSLGMKQRLGIAAALLPDPELLILDEPTNGLDPAGIREIRALLRELVDGGMTVFVSSHLLSEVEQICDHVVMIRGGRLLFQGRIQELLGAGDPRILLSPERGADARRLLTVLAEDGVRAEIRLDGPPTVAAGSCDQRIVVVAHAPERMAADLNRAAMRAGIVLRGLRTHRPNLEETFLRATGVTDADSTDPADQADPADGVYPSDGAHPAESDRAGPTAARRAGAGRRRGGR